MLYYRLGTTDIKLNISLLRYLYIVEWWFASSFEINFNLTHGCASSFLSRFIYFSNINILLVSEALKLCHTCNIIFMGLPRALLKGGVREG